MREPRPWAAAGTVVALVAALAVFDLRLFTGGDNVHYIALAKALAEGRGYVDLIAPEHPPHTQYPPGFPLVLAPAWWLGGGRLFVLKLVSWVAAAFALAGAYGLARHDRAAPAWTAAAVVWLVGLYSVFLAYAHWILSEMTYLAVSLWALAAFVRGEDDDRPTGWWLAGCALALAGFGVRTAGITLLAAAVLWALLGGWWRRAATAAATAILGGAAWLLWSSRNPPPTGGYLDQLLASNPYDPTSASLGLAELLGRAFGRLVTYATVEFPRLFWPGAGEAPLGVRSFGLLLGGALLVLGLWRALRVRGVEVWDLYLGMSLVMLVLWPWTGDRFFLTIAPLVWLYVLFGLDHASGVLARRSIVAPAMAGVLALLLLVGALRRAPAAWEINRRHLDGDLLAGYEPYWQDTFDAARWLGVHAPHAVIVARKPTFAWYWSGGRPAFVYPFRYDPEATWREIRSRGATHILLDSGGVTATYLVPALQAHLDAIEAVYAARSRLVYVLQIAPAEVATP